MDDAIPDAAVGAFSKRTRGLVYSPQCIYLGLEVALPFLTREKDASIERLTALVADMMVDMAGRDAEIARLRAALEYVSNWGPKGRRFGDTSPVQIREAARLALEPPGDG